MDQEPQSAQGSTSITCRSHSVHTHEFFLNYRVSTEGVSHSSKLKPVVQMIYESLSCKKRKTGESIFVYWDKQCLNFGQNWQRGFLLGLQNAKVIVLLISAQALAGIRKNASKQQDNVLLEYECALLLNSLRDTFVIPIFIGSIKGDEKSLTESDPLEFDRFSPSNQAPFPDSPHVRSPEAMEIIRTLSASIHPSKRNYLGSISATMKQLFMLQGTPLTNRGTQQQELDKVIEILVETLSKAESTTLLSHLSTSLPSISSSISSVPSPQTNPVAVPSPTSAQCDLNVTFDIGVPSFTAGDVQSSNYIGELHPFSLPGHEASSITNLNTAEPSPSSSLVNLDTPVVSSVSSSSLQDTYIQIDIPSFIATSPVQTIPKVEDNVPQPKISTEENERGISRKMQGWIAGILWHPIKWMWHQLKKLFWRI